MPEPPPFTLHRLAGAAVACASSPCTWRRYASGTRTSSSWPYAEGGRTYRGVARLFRLEDEHQKLFDFLKNHDLKVD